MRKTPQRSLEYLGPSLLETLLWMPSGNNITFWETTMINTQDEQHYRDQTVSEITKQFHTLRTELGIRDFERHLVLKYRGALHRYIQT